MRLRPICNAGVSGNHWLAVMFANAAIDGIRREDAIDVFVGLKCSPRCICLTVGQPDRAHGNRVLACLVPLLTDGQRRNFHRGLKHFALIHNVQWKRRLTRLRPWTYPCPMPFGVGWLAIPGPLPSWRAQEVSGCVLTFGIVLVLIGAGKPFSIDIRKAVMCVVRPRRLRTN